MSDTPASAAVPAPAAAAVTPDIMANAIRALAMDAVQAANSGHPGAPMGMADMAVALWGRHLRHNPVNPQWADRDRFVLSNGHASMLIYALLHLSGYKLPIDELKAFRQLGSKTAGHPEVGHTPGVETTTGPLGQGITNAVGMALAEKLLAAEFNRDGHAIVDHRTYVFLGDGCLMEGISHEAVALAGAWKLNKLIALYDDNGISIDGQVAPWFIDDTPKRFEACGWNVIRGVDGHDVDAVDRAIADARNSADKPTLIVCKTAIGKGSPNRANTAKAHGEPLGKDEIVLTREALGWSHEPFKIPKDVYAAWDAKAAGKAPGSRLERQVQGLQGRLSRAGQGVRAPHEGRAAQGFPPGRRQRRRRSPHQGRDRGQPQGQPDRAGALHRGPARDAGRLGRPDRLQPDQHQVHPRAAC
jgi:transketolase